MKLVKPHKGGPTFGGVFSNDELTKVDLDKVYILNLQNSDQPGSHWTLLYAGWYFDSYGVPATKRMSQYVTSYNPYDYQGLSKNSCGHMCMYVASRIIAGLKPYTGDLVPNKSLHNENVLERFFYGSISG